MWQFLRKVERIDWGRFAVPSLILLVIGAASAPFWPKTYNIDPATFCRGYYAGWPEGYCGEAGPCPHPAPDRCPTSPRTAHHPSFIEGVYLGMAAGMEAAGIYPDDHPPRTYDQD